MTRAAPLSPPHVALVREKAQSVVAFSSRITAARESFAPHAFCGSTVSRVEVRVAGMLTADRKPVAREDGRRSGREGPTRHGQRERLRGRRVQLQWRGEGKDGDVVGRARVGVIVRGMDAERRDGSVLLGVGGRRREGAETPACTVSWPGWAIGSLSPYTQCAAVTTCDGVHERARAARLADARVVGDEHAPRSRLDWIAAPPTTRTAVDAGLAAPAAAPVRSAATSINRGSLTFGA